MHAARRPLPRPIGDGVHANARGHAVVFAAIAATLAAHARDRATR